MLFSAKVVSVNNNVLTIILLAVIEFFLNLLMILLFDSFREYAGYTFVGIMVVALIAMLFTKGHPSTYDLIEGLFVYDNHLEIEKIIFPFSEISNLKFSFRSFKGMMEFSYDIDVDADLKETSGTYVYGISNEVSFRYKNQSFNYQIFVENQQHFFQFVRMLEQLYLYGISFEEENWQGKTFLMQNVTEERYQELKQAYY